MLKTTWLIFRRFLVAAVLCLLLSRCGTRADPPPEIRIGVIASLSGPAAENSGRATTEAANLAVQQVNAEGGLLVGDVRYQVRLIFGDDENNAQTAVDVARRLIFQERVVALVGPQFSSNAIPVASVAEEARLPMISPISTNPQTTAGKQYVFRVGFVDEVQGQVMAQFARDEFAATTAAVLYDIASDYNRGMAETFQRQFTANGGSIVAFEAYTSGATDFRPALQRIAASNPDVLFLPNYSADSIAQANQAREGGMTLPLLGSDGWTATSVAPVPAFEGAFFTQHWHPAVENPASAAFLRDYTAAYAHEPLVTAALTYDAFSLLFAAMEREGSVTPEAIERGLASTADFAGVSGRIGYAGTGDPIKDVVIVEIKDGQALYYSVVQP